MLPDTALSRLADDLDHFSSDLRDEVLWNGALWSDGSARLSALGLLHIDRLTHSLTVFRNRLEDNLIHGEQKGNDSLR